MMNNMDTIVTSLVALTPEEQHCLVRHKAIVDSRESIPTNVVQVPKFKREFVDIKPNISTPYYPQYPKAPYRNAKITPFDSVSSMNPICSPEWLCHCIENRVEFNCILFREVDNASEDDDGDGDGEDKRMEIYTVNSKTLAEYSNETLSALLHSFHIVNVPTGSTSPDNLPVIGLNADRQRHNALAYGSRKDNPVQNSARSYNSLLYKASSPPSPSPPPQPPAQELSIGARMEVNREKRRIYAKEYRERKLAELGEVYRQHERDIHRRWRHGQKKQLEKYREQLVERLGSDNAAQQKEKKKKVYSRKNNNKI